MIMEIDKSEFVKEFDNYNRSENFSVAGREVLFDYLDSFDENYKLDVIGICCEFTEYENVEEYLKEHDSDINKDDYIDEDTKEFDEDEYLSAIEEEIESNTSLIKICDNLNEGFIIQNY